MVLEKSLASAMNAKLAGSGHHEETIVLAHGYGGDQSVWHKVLPYLTQHYQVLVFDWPFSGAVANNNKDNSNSNNLNLFDHGKYCSYDAFALDLIALLDEFNLKSTVFIGHSMSGMIGCIASIKRPHLFKNLILIGASPRYINEDEYEGGFEMSEITEIISAIESNYHDWAAYFAKLTVDKNDPLSVDKFVNSLQRMRPEVALAVAKTVFHSDQRDILDKVTTPTTIITTTSDIVAPKSVAFFMHKNIKGNTSVEIINGNGHFPQLTAHLELLDVVGQVLGIKFDHRHKLIG